MLFSSVGSFSNSSVVSLKLLLFPVLAGVCEDVVKLGLEWDLSSTSQVLISRECFGRTAH